MRVLLASKSLKKTKVVQNLKHLLIIDFEATCAKDIPITTPEIIEFPCVAMNTTTWDIENVFHEYVKPRINPILSPFCTDLTGIMQETVEDEQPFPVVFEKFQKWLEENGYLENFTSHSSFVTCGDWDLKVMLPNQCALDGLTVPGYFQQWIDLKKIFCDANKYFPRSLKDMLHRLNLPCEGRLHSGLSDSLNMAKIIQALTNKTPVNFNVTSYSNK